MLPSCTGTRSGCSLRVGRASRYRRDFAHPRYQRRTPGEHARGAIEGFVNIPVDELREHLDQIPANKPVYLHCKSGQRSYIAYRILAGNGYECYNLAGGYDRWSAVTQG